MAADGKGTVLVTGVNGYIASAAAQAFLNAGYLVRGSVRSRERSAQALDQAFSKELDAGQLEIIEVPESGGAGAWDAAVRGVVGIASVAAPGIESLTDVAETVRTAKAVVNSLLSSAEMHAGPQLRAVVLLSSLAALHADPIGPGFVFKETDFVPQMEEVVVAMGDKATKPMVYLATKVAVENAFWGVVNSTDRQSRFTGAVVNPGYCIGPSVVLPSEPANLPPSVRCAWHIFAGHAWPEDFNIGVFVDVRDVAAALVFCIAQPDSAAGRRFLLAGPKGNNQAIADVLREALPDRRDAIRVGEPGKGYNADFKPADTDIWFDGTAIVAASGHDYTPFKISVVDAARSFEPFIRDGKDAGMGDEVPVLF